MAVRKTRPGKNPFFITARDGANFGVMAVVEKGKLVRWSEDHGKRFLRRAGGS